jgi:hypothetical protein
VAELGNHASRLRAATYAASRSGRGLTTAVRASHYRDPLDDPLVAEQLDHIRADGNGGRVARWLAALTLFGLDRLNMCRRLSGSQLLTLDEVREALVREGTVDVDLVDDCLALVRGMRDSPQRSTAVAEQVRCTIETWGPYALVTEAIIAWRLVLTVADELPGTAPEELFQAWSLAEDLFGTGDLAPHPEERHDGRDSRDGGRRGPGNRHRA